MMVNTWNSWFRHHGPVYLVAVVLDAISTHAGKYK